MSDWLNIFDIDWEEQKQSAWFEVLKILFNLIVLDILQDYISRFIRFLYKYYKPRFLLLRKQISCIYSLFMRSFEGGAGRSVPVRENLRNKNLAFGYYSI